MKSCIKCGAEAQILQTEDGRYYVSCSDEDCIHEFNTATQAFPDKISAKLAWQKLLIEIKQQTTLLQHTNTCPKCSGTGYLPTKKLESLQQRIKQFKHVYGIQKKSIEEVAELISREGFEITLRQLIQYNKAVRKCNRCKGKGYLSKRSDTIQTTLF